jgi:hypothetical protein
MRMLCKGTIPELARPAPHNPLLNTGNGELIYVAQIWHIFLEKISAYV